MAGSQTTVYASAARTATPTAVIVNARNMSAARIVIDVTAVTSTPSVTYTIDVLDAASGKYVNVYTSSAIATVSTTVALVQGLTGNVRVTATHGNANSITYTVALHWTR